jgi:uncharacterized protein
MTPVTQELEQEAGTRNQEAVRSKTVLGSRRQKTVWIDIDNSPHVPFFLPIIEELEKEGIEVVLTARNIYQVCELLEFFHLPCKVIGKHYGKNKFLKVAGTLLRALQLAPTAAFMRPDVAISHGSRAQLLICKALRIPTIMMHDYEHSTKTGFLEADWVLMPDVIPDGLMARKSDTVLRYPGLKEDVYVPRFRPDPSILSELGISKDDLVVTVRPPATEAHYHNPESEILFAETLRRLSSHPNVRAVTLPRNARQGEQLRAEWSDLIASGQLVVPSAPLDGLNLIWFSDLVISGGGTMNREAAALGVPVYSIFRGTLGAVDRYLAETGRLTMIENTSDVHTKIKLVRWDRPAKPEDRNCPVLECIVDNILSVLEFNDQGRKRLRLLPGGQLPESDKA